VVGGVWRVGCGGGLEWAKGGSAVLWVWAGKVSQSMAFGDGRRERACLPGNPAFRTGLM
jgi:hypothetical protein